MGLISENASPGVGSESHSLTAPSERAKALE
jgi:hypothetical protein